MENELKKVLNDKETESVQNELKKEKSCGQVVLYLAFYFVLFRQITQTLKHNISRTHS